MDTIVTIIVIVAVLTFWAIIKFGIPAYISKKFENVAQKQDIEKLTKKIEAVKTTFEKDKIKFSLYHQTQAQVLKDLYSKLSECIDQMREFVCPVYTDSDIYEKEHKITIDYLTNVDIFIRRNAIYLNENLKLKITELLISFREAILYKNLSQQNKPMTESYSKQYMRAFDELEEKSTPILMQIEQEFREILSGERPINSKNNLS